MARDDHSTKGVVRMLHSKQGKILVAVLVLALVVIATTIAVSKPDTQVAQGPPPQMGPGAGGGMPPGGMGPGGPPPGGPMPGPNGFRPGQMGMMGGGMMGGMMPQMPAITATAEAVFVIQGNTLYKYDKNLSFLKKVELPRPVPTNPMDGPGAPPMSNPNTP